jgi:hypothetical protein
MNLTNILWSTRGYYWGFLRLLQPANPQIDWLLPYEEMFREATSYEPEYYSGKIRLSAKDIKKYVAIRFVDPEERKDYSGRPITHEVALLGEDSDTFHDFESFKKAVWDYLAPIYDEVYKYDIAQIQSSQLIIEYNTLKVIRKNQLPISEQGLLGTEVKKKPTSKIIIVIGTIIMIVVIVVIIVFLIKKQQPETNPPTQNQSEQPQILQKTTLNQVNQNQILPSSETETNPPINQTNQEKP